MSLDFLFRVFEEHRDKPAVIWRDRETSFGSLLDRVRSSGERLAAAGVEPGAVAVVEGECTPGVLALLLALIDRRCIVVPLTSSVEAQKEEFIEAAMGEAGFAFDGDTMLAPRRFDRAASHPLYDRLRSQEHPGLVLFSSGSTGRNKAVVHDVEMLIEKFRTRRHSLRTLAFLLLDHIGGIDTILYTLSNAGCLVAVEDRSPDAVAAAIERHRVEVLPVSPTFLKLLLLSEAHLRHDLSSLKYITYGAEVMPESVLKRCVEAFPGVNFLQKYGTTEVGAMRSKSRSAGSLWVRLGGEGYQTRVVDGMLQIKARSAMLGYLNAPSPFTADGWFMTGDMVEQDGEYLRILGRKSELVNVGGEKVYPAEVENVIARMPAIADVRVYGEKNAILGAIVCADVVPSAAQDARALAAEVKRECAKHLSPYKVPVKVNVLPGDLHGGRFKQVRRVG
jgi:long-chain acyl-CoA synthetase